MWGRRWPAGQQATATGQSSSKSHLSALDRSGLCTTSTTRISLRVDWGIKAHTISHNINVLMLGSTLEQCSAMSY